jgi:hypothetical protein
MQRFAMQHSFIFKPWKWSATGACFTADGTSTTVRSAAVVQHGPVVWLIDGWMEWRDGSNAAVKNTYKVVPIQPGGAVTTWTCENPVLGKCNGTLTIVDNSIIMEYQSETEDYHGAEFLLHISDEMYLNRGALFKKDKLVSSWAVILTAEEPTKARKSDRAQRRSSKSRRKKL